MLLHPRTPPVLVCALLGAVLSACGSGPHQHDANQSRISSEPATAAPSAPAASEPTIPVARAIAIQPNQLITASALLGNPMPDSYAFREDARHLALELAQSMDLDPQWVWAAISKAKVKDNVARLMMPAPSGTAKNWSVYRSRFVEAQRIRAGVQFWRDNIDALERAQAEYGVPAQIIAGVIGVETIYGRNKGGFRILDALTTLTLDFPKGRSDRSAFFKAELGQYLKLCAEQQIEPETTLGSYAGAIGLPQFMPSSIRKFAVDFDNDGHIDLIDNPSDAIGSVARYLSAHGWHTDWPVYFQITPPPESQALAKLLAPDIVPSFTVQEMHNMGAVLSLEAQNHPGRLALVLLENGQNAPTLIAGTQNFYAITRYNQSSYYALAVVQLGQAVEQAYTRQFALNP